MMKSQNTNAVSIHYAIKEIEPPKRAIIEIAVKWMPFGERTFYIEIYII